MYRIRCLQTFLMGTDFTRQANTSIHQKKQNEKESKTYGLLIYFILSLLFITFILFLLYLRLFFGVVWDIPKLKNHKGIGLKRYPSPLRYNTYWPFATIWYFQYNAFWRRNQQNKNKNPKNHIYFRQVTLLI